MRLCCAISRQPEMTLDAYIGTLVTLALLTLDAYIVTLAADRVAFAGARNGMLYISFHRNFFVKNILVLEFSLRVA